ncbi:helix-turn-helix domain-containing protein [Acutalibacter caecimuris]|uniref:helix-turn-helix domain-containing protein n=1 Tax=Acutalibacter caecimuris TaxID=3093657 RepID=UPI002AC8FD79|nr:helix-turn-helix transcriptional regulator [Acutalibacter sp. M00118]
MRMFHAEMKVYFRNIVNVTQGEMDLTIEEMAHLLFMSPRSLSYLVSGKNCCSAVTLMLFLAYLPNDTMIRVVRDFYDIVLDDLEKGSFA